MEKMRYVCTDCGSGFDGEPLVYNGSVFCRRMCLEHFKNAEAQRQAEANAKAYAKLNVEQTSSQTAGSNSGSNGVNSAAGAAITGAGMAAAGVGVAVKGIGSLVSGIGKGGAAIFSGAGKGVGSALAGAGKGVGVMGELMKEGVNQSKMNTQIAKDLLNYKFSNDPENYKKEISEMYATAMMKASFPPNTQEWSKQTYAKKRLCQEFESMARINPVMYANYVQQHEILKKKKSAWTKFLIGFGVFFIGFFVLFPMIALSASDGKYKKENLRLESIVKEIDDAIANKDYDAALYKATKLQWSIEDGSYGKEHIKKWDARREEITATIEKLSGRTTE